MRILNLPVEDTVADNYNNASQKEKNKINSMINILLSKLFSKNGHALFDTMNAMSLQSSKNELTIEKLGDLMEWDDDTMKNLFGEDYHRPNA